VGSYKITSITTQMTAHCILPKVLPYLFLPLIFIPEISGSVMARVPNGITGEWCRLLLSARRIGESKIGGSIANGPLRSGELAPVVSKHK
jgi:hypothetical protein